MKSSFVVPCVLALFAVSVCADEDVATIAAEHLLPPVIDAGVEAATRADGSKSDGAAGDDGSSDGASSEGSPGDGGGGEASSDAEGGSTSDGGDASSDKA